MDIADSLNYYPKAFAQGLARKNSKMITVLVPVLSNYFFMEVLAGIQDKILETEYDLNIYNLNISKETTFQDQIDNVIKRGMADGFVLVSVHQQDAYWDQIKNSKIPVVLIDEYHHDYDSISVDSVDGAYAATKHLIDMGYSNLALISAHPNSKPMKDRNKGYRRALEDSGITVNDKNIILSDVSYRDGFTEENGYQAMEQIIKSNKFVDAIVSASDIQAIGAMKAMKDHNVKIPIIGFDDLPISNFLALSTMKQPMYEMGALAIQKLIDRITNPNRLVSHTVFSPEIVQRDSTYPVDVVT